MRSLHRIFALLTLFGWLWAIGHVVLEDGGVAESGAWHAESGDTHEDGHEQDHGGELHHHDFSVMAGRLGSKALTLPAFALPCLPLSERIAALLAPVRVPPAQPCLKVVREDRRTFGWLLICRTALPVRGPSLAV